MDAAVQSEAVLLCADARFSLAATAPCLVDLAERGAADGAPDRVRLRAKLLEEALADLAATRRGLHRSKAESPAELQEAYARDHLRV